MKHPSAHSEPVSADLAYAGELSPQEAWDILAKEADAVLVDVRTVPEWSFIGTPDPSELGKTPLLLSWKTYPTMEVNTEFQAKLSEEAPNKEAPLLFLCRTGARSLDAAIAMTAQGYTHCYNITDGFEGSLDEAEHRGNSTGWKATNLPWRQS